MAIRSTIIVNVDPNKIIRSRNFPRVQKRFVKLVRLKSDPYVPYLTGDLKNTVKEQEKALVYDSKHGGRKSYAAINYYANRGMGREGLNRGGKRGKQWIPRMWNEQGNAIVNSVARWIGGRPG